MSLTIREETVGHQGKTNASSVVKLDIGRLSVPGDIWFVTHAAGKDIFRLGVIKVSTRVSINYLQARDAELELEKAAGYTDIRLTTKSITT